MIVYLDSSAAVAMLLGEDGFEAVELAWLRADARFASILTGIECARALTRARSQRRITALHRDVLRRAWRGQAEAITRIDITDEVAERASGDFPVEPVRSLDAIHLATVLTLRERVGELTILSVDDRVRANAVALGLPVLP